MYMQAKMAQCIDTIVRMVIGRRTRVAAGSRRTNLNPAYNSNNEHAVPDSNVRRTSVARWEDSRVEEEDSAAVVAADSSAYG
jgi:hypothetical protein